MNNHPPPSLIHRPTTTQILKQTTAVFSTRHHLLPFLLLSFILLFVRNEIETITDSLTSFIDNDPSIKSLFPPKPTTQNHHRHYLTGDVDFFTEEDKFKHRFFVNSFTTKPQSNSTPIILDSFNTRWGFSNAKLPFKLIKNSVSVNDRNTEIEDQRFTAVLVLVASCVPLVFILLVHVLSLSFLHGIIFVLVVNIIIKKHTLFMNTFRKGVILGSKRVLWLFILRSFIMHLFVQILSVWFLGCEDQYSVFKILFRMRFLPFSIPCPYVKGLEKEIYRFVLSYVSLDLLISYVFGVCVWVDLADSRKTSKEVLREGFRLLSLSKVPAIGLKFLEIFVSGSLAKFILSLVFGEFLASFIQTLMVIYLMVAWMIYYISVKSMDANSRGVPFGRREFEDMLKVDEDDI